VWLTSATRCSGNWRTGGDQNQLQYWDEMLSQRGSLLIHARIAINHLERQAIRIHGRLTGGQEVLRMI
jgi:recombinational DNA repair ATPase RecF